MNLAVEFGVYVAMALAVSRARAGLEQERLLAARLDEVNQALNRETMAVGSLQRELLPGGPPKTPGYQWETYYATSTRAGGDYYDFFPLADGRIGFLLADASGHGAPAAVLMAMTRVLLHAASDGLHPPDRVLARLNLQLARTLPQGGFVTAFYGVLDPAGGRIEYALAGHDPPLLIRAADGTPRRLPHTEGFPLGLFPESRYESVRELLGPGDTLVLHTDGLTDAMSADRELFGEERLVAALEEIHPLPLPEIRAGLLARVHAHTVGTPLQDDLTLLLLRRLTS